MSDTDVLRELHEVYIWEVNAAVGEGRMDLVQQLADEYTDQALELMTAMSSGCERPDCVICARRSPAPTVPARGRWHWRSRRRGAA
jgi:hypothetical protein